jgi:hypothetical protein
LALRVTINYQTRHGIDIYVAIPSTVGLLRQARRRVLRVIGRKYPKCAKRLEETYGEGDVKGRRATEEDLVREVELTRAFF